MPVNIKNIAEYANVSISTVSRALNDDPLIAGKTRKKIKDLARELNYVPNHFGRGLRAQKSRLVGYLIANIHDSFYSEIMQGMSQVLTQQGYSLVVGMTQASPESERRQLELFREKSVDGIIVSNYAPETVPYLRAMADDGIPLVICDNESFAPDIPFIKVDDGLAMRLLTQHLVDLGHKRMAYCYPINSHSFERYTAHKVVAQALGCPGPVLCKNVTELETLLDKPERPTAIVCYSDYIAIEIKHLVESMGLSVPGDIAITGFDDIAFAGWPEIGLTTIAQPRIDLGRMAANTLFDMMSGKTVSSNIVKPDLVERKSTVAE